MIQTVSYDKFLTGIFKCELKNRFLCLVEIGGIDTVCYIPSSSKLGNYIDLKNKQVLLTPIKTSKSKTKFSVFAIKFKQNYILLNTSLPNSLIFNNLSSRRFSYLGKRNNIQKEKSIDGYKCDIFVSDTNTIIEIKSIISTSNIALFPSVYSERAIKQLEQIYNLLDKGYNICYLFVSLNPYLKEIAINSDDIEYCELFYKCVKKGMLVHAVSAQIDEDMRPTIKSNIIVKIQN